MACELNDENPKHLLSIASNGKSNQSHKSHCMISEKRLTGFFNKMELFNLEKPKENFLQQEKYGLRYNVSFSGYIFSSFWNGKNK